MIVEGGRTNKAFLLALLGHPDVIAGHYDTEWLDARVATGELLEPLHAGVALLCAAVEAYEVEHALARSSFYAQAARGLPTTRAEIGHRIEFRYRGRPLVVRVYQVGPTSYRVATGSSLVDLDVERLGGFEQRVEVLGRRYRVVSAVMGPLHTVDVDDVTHMIARDEGGVVRAPTPAVVVRVSVSPGDDVAVGDPLVVLESMKMETVVTAAFPARVRSLLVVPNVQVDAGAPLVQLEPRSTETETGPGAAAELDFGPGVGPADDADAVRAYLLGYDLDPASVRNIVGGVDPCHDLAADDPERLRQEAQILSLFADLCAISRREPEHEDDIGEQLRAPEEHLLTCLRSHDIDGDHLPRAFLDRLLRVVRHYGHTDLDRVERTARRPHARVPARDNGLGEVLPAIAAILDRRLTHVESRRATADDDLRSLLDHLIDATDGRFPSLSDLARDVRFRYFEQPLLGRAQADWYAEMDGHLRALAEGCDQRERATHMAALITCPQPMRPKLLRWFQGGSQSVRDIVLEVAARRYYRIRDLGDVRLVEIEGQQLAVNRVPARRSHVPPRGRLRRGRPSSLAPRGRRRHLVDVACDFEPILDVHLWQGETADDVEAIGERLRSTIESIGLGRPAHRIDVTITIEPSDMRQGNTYHYTFRSTEQGLVEEHVYRNLHPMLAKRLDVERLCRFAITRLDSAEDVYLFLGIARSNAKDERLFALAEVRDLTPQRDEAGRTVGFPLLERVLTDALAGIRRFQSHRAAWTSDSSTTRSSSTCGRPGPCPPTPCASSRTEWRPSLADSASRKSSST